MNEDQRSGLTKGTSQLLEDRKAQSIVSDERQSIESTFVGLDRVNTQRFMRRAGESREDTLRVMRTLTELGRTISDCVEFDEIMLNFVDTCAALVKGSEASVLETRGAETLFVLVASSPRKRTLDDLQIAAKHGWMFEILNGEDSRLDVSLEAHLNDLPAIVPSFLSAGMHSVHTIALNHQNVRIGLLDLCDPKEFPLSALQVEILTLLADGMATAIGNRRSHIGAEATVRQLQEALDSRVIVEQAKGMISAGVGVSIDAAFSLLRTFSRARHSKIHQIAKLVVAGDLPLTTFDPRRAAIGEMPSPRGL